VAVEEKKKPEKVPNAQEGSGVPIEGKSQQ